LNKCKDIIWKINRIRKSIIYREKINKY